MDNWEAQIMFHPGKVANAVYLSRKLEAGVREYLTDGGTTYKTVKLREPSKEDPKLEFAWLDDTQIEALVAAFDKHGVKPPDAGFVKGKLEAVSEHLADMRHLVFKDDQ